MGNAVRYCLGAVCGALCFVHAAAWAADAPDPGLLMQTGWLASGGEQIYYESVGTGEAVVLSHGLGGNHVIWYQQVPELARSYRVITWDQRGFGRSTNEQNQSSPAAAVKDLKALLDHLNVDQAHVVGQSMGGWAVLGFALKYPERVRSVVMADTIGGIYTKEIAGLFDKYIRGAATSPLPDELSITQHPALGNAIGAQDPAQAFLYRQVGSLTQPAPSNMGMLLRGTSYPVEDVKALALPVLFIVGEHDPIFPPEMIDLAAQMIPGALTVRLPNAGHSPYFETPEAWNQTVLEFLKGLDD